MKQIIENIGIIIYLSLMMIKLILKLCNIFKRQKIVEFLIDKLLFRCKCLTQVLSFPVTALIFPYNFSRSSDVPQGTCRIHFRDTKNNTSVQSFFLCVTLNLQIQSQPFFLYKFYASYTTPNITNLVSLYESKTIMFQH